MSIELRKQAIKILQELNKLDEKAKKREHQYSMQNCTQARMQKLSADASWDGMERQKLEHRLHVAMVDLQIVKPEAEDYYENSFFRPSYFHKYEWIKEKPKCYHKKTF
jgi:hypothetical protein